MENSLLTTWRQKIKENKNYKIISISVISLLSLVILLFIYRQFIVVPAQEKASDGWWKALNYIEKDSTDQAIKLLVPHVKKYDGYKGGEVGQFLLGTQYMKKGEFRLALKSLEGVNTTDQYISVMSLGMQGDCHSELKQYGKAMAKYKEAALGGGFKFGLYNILRALATVVFALVIMYFIRKFIKERFNRRENANRRREFIIMLIANSFVSILTVFVCFNILSAPKRDNEFTTPMYLFKAGLHAEKINNTKEAKELYTKIKDDYPNYANQKTIDKYIARVSTANKK